MKELKIDKTHVKLISNEISWHNKSIIINSNYLTRVHIDFNIS